LSNFINTAGVSATGVFDAVVSILGNDIALEPDPE
jgi:hypothetical protein